MLACDCAIQLFIIIILKLSEVKVDKLENNCLRLQNKSWDGIRTLAGFILFRFFRSRCRVPVTIGFAFRST